VSLSAIAKPLRAEVLKRDAGRCRYCGLVQIGQATVFHVDHILPKSKGGPTTIDNLALQCPHCSLHKSNKTHAPDAQSGQSVALFHPLSQPWPDHFTLDADGTMYGKTEVGRATIDALAMNDLWPRAARALQIATGLIAERT
jgi:hypothetical protein